MAARVESWSLFYCVGVCKTNRSSSAFPCLAVLWKVTFSWSLLYFLMCFCLQGEMHEQFNHSLCEECKLRPSKVWLSWCPFGLNTDFWVQNSKIDANVGKPCNLKLRYSKNNFLAISRFVLENKKLDVASLINIPKWCIYQGKCAPLCWTPPSVCMVQTGSFVEGEDFSFWTFWALCAQSVLCAQRYSLRDAMRYAQSYFAGTSLQPIEVRPVSHKSGWQANRYLIGQTVNFDVRA